MSFKRFHISNRLLSNSICIFTFIGTLIYSQFFINFENSSYVKSLDFSSIKNCNKACDTRFGNIFIHVSEKKQIILSDSSGKTKVLLSSFIEYSDSNSCRKILKLQDFNTTFDSSKREIVFEHNNKIVSLSITISGNNGNQTTSLSIQSLYHENIKLHRSAIILSGIYSPSLIINKSGEWIARNFQKEYWSDNGQILFNFGKTYILTQGSKDISSLQYDKSRGNIWINLDFEYDHPFIHIPLGYNYNYVNLSASKISAGTLSEHEITLEQLNNPKLVIHPTRFPHGFLSGMIFTEHADNTNLMTQRAVYFGNSSIHSSDSAIGGFVKHSIPVTKSIFYTNNSKSNNSNWNEEFYEEDISAKSNKEYQFFLNELFKRGIYEVALHSADPVTESHSDTKEALEYVSQNFKSKTWIDHGMSSGSINREAFVSDGLDSSSDHFRGDLWKNYSIKYFWNSSYEKLSDCSSLRAKFADFRILQLIYCLSDRYFGDINNLRYSDGEQVPTPVYWRNNYQSGDFISWGTQRHAGHHSAKLWSFILRDEVIKKLINEQGLAIIHFYPAFVGRRFGYYNGIWEQANSKIVISKEFDFMLSKLSYYRDKKKLHLTTISDFLDYQLLIENIHIAYGSNQILITNNNFENIDGFTFTSMHSSLWFSGVNFKRSKHKNYWIYTVNLKANSTTTIFVSS